MIMMYGRGFYGAGTCGFFGPMMMIGFVILIAALVYFLLKSNKSKSSDSKSIDTKVDDSNALAILKEKFANGEITEEVYLNKKNVIERR